MGKWSKPDHKRITQQMNDHQYPYVGHAVTWRHYVSASGGVDVAGIGPTPMYRESIITAFLGQFVPPQMRQHQVPGGMIEAGTFYAVSREPLDAQDEIIWNGALFRIEGSATRSPLTLGYIVEIKKATP